MEGKSRGEEGERKTLVTSPAHSVTRLSIFSPSRPYFTGFLLSSQNRHDWEGRSSSFYRPSQDFDKKPAYGDVGASPGCFPGYGTQRQQQQQHQQPPPRCERHRRQHEVRQLQLQLLPLADDAMRAEATSSSSSLTQAGRAKGKCSVLVRDGVSSQADRVPIFTGRISGGLSTSRF